MKTLKLSTRGKWLETLRYGGGGADEGGEGRGAAPLRLREGAYGRAGDHQGRAVQVDGFKTRVESTYEYRIEPVYRNYSFP
jgi:hypothetical protein